MKKLVSVLIIHLVLLGCEKVEELPSNFIEGKFVYAQGNIYTKDLNWTNRKELTSDAIWSNKADFFYVMEQWSADGLQILYLREARDNTNSIMLMNSNGDNKRQVIEYYGSTLAMDWSNNSQWIAYTRVRDDGSIHIISVNGEEHKLINKFSDKSVNRISWSTDSKKMAVCTSDGFLSIMDFESEEVLYKTEYQNIYSNLYWSPNDKFIVYSTEGGPTGKIILINVNDKTEEKIKTEARYELFGWTPDSEYIIYLTGFDKGMYGDFIALQVSTRKEIKLVYKSEGWLDYPEGDLFIFE